MKIRFSYENLRFRYEPYPIGLAKPIMSSKLYQQLVDSYPPIDLFLHKTAIGSKYALGEGSNPEIYKDFVKNSEYWGRFYSWIKGGSFIDDVLAALAEHYIDLGHRRRHLTSRFEFSMLPADGGHILPHTDAQKKIITLVVSMCGEQEWDPALGGGTDVNTAKDIRFMYNWCNKQASFDDVNVIDTFEFVPNQAVVFIKTFNSWHSVRRMNAAGSPLMRKTITINVEADPWREYASATR